MAIGPYRLDELGWLQFERLSGLVLAQEAGLADVTWLGRADRGRVALVDERVALPGMRVRLRGPLAIAVIWVRPSESAAERLTQLLDGVTSVPSELGFWFDRVLVLTNLDRGEAEILLGQRFGEATPRFVILGAAELGECLDRHPELRAAMPSTLGLRDIDSLIASDARSRSTLDVVSAQELARVFWPTRAYARARAVLRRHRFIVLTGPPEMGKTAIARMIALAQLTDGWEAHECTSPDQVWRAFDPERRQVFVADDAFGSTEYRPDAAELWARDLGRMLAALDDRHWLIWTSRPAPLKAGLRRVQRERGSEHFPAPGEVLVDASELDLAEKTLILFRHAKAHQSDEAARSLVRSAGVSIVEHPHFTPERIRRLVVERLDALAAVTTLGDVFAVVESELARPTDAMRHSFRALEEEHRELLVALLDAPAGLIDERELTATVRRHHAGGLRRPPSEVIDRLTDHFLRVTPLGIGWVHPSWRDLVIEELRSDAAARRRFLSACGIYGVLLALSQQGGPAGERALPLLIGDSDWDALGDRLGELLSELDDHDAGRLLLALADALNAKLEPAQRAEAQCLTEYVLGALSRTWHKQPRPVPVFLLDAWYAAHGLRAENVASPPVRLMWLEVHPSREMAFGRLSAQDLQRLDDWLALAQILAVHDPDALERLGFNEEQSLLAHVAVELGEIEEPDLKPVAETLLSRIRELSPLHVGFVRTTLVRLRAKPSDDRWWVPHDIDTPPSREPVTDQRIGFTREDVGRVLADL